jgi:hypothetical protein
MRTSHFWLLTAVCCLGQTLARAGEPSPADLIQLTPAVRSTDPEVRSIEMVGIMKDGLHLRFRALYKAPDHYSLLVSDGSDGTPLVFVADRQLLCYDPIRSSVLCLKGCSEQLSFESDGKAASFLFGFLPEDRRSHAQNSLKIDVKSVCEKLCVVDRVVKTGESQYRLFLLKDQKSLVCSFDLAKAQPFEGLKVFDQSGHEPLLSIDKLVINGPLADDEFRFPDRERLARKLKVHEMAGGGFAPAEFEVAKITTAIMARLGATHPGIRESLKEPAFQNLDWKAVVKRDRKTSAILRDLVPVDKHSTIDPKAKQAKSATGESTVK